MSEWPSSVSIEERVFVLRDHEVMLDFDLAELFAVPTRYLNQQVRRNRWRFPRDFAFRLTIAEWRDLSRRRGIVDEHGGRRHRAYVFTELGAGMLASVLRGPRTSQITIEILRMFKRRRGDPPPPPTPEQLKERSTFAAMRDAAFLLPRERRYTRREPYTYFVQAGPDGPIKIGSTKNLIVRLRALSVMLPVPLRVLGVIKGDHEQWCHARFAPFRLRGEWFAPVDVLLEFIREKALKVTKTRDGG